MMRNGMKLYAGKYKKGKKETLRIDEKQDREFRDELRFSIMRNITESARSVRRITSVAVHRTIMMLIKNLRQDMT